jgi:hypothetical protein
MTGVPPDELVQIRKWSMPPGTDYLWEWFLRLSSTRMQGFGVAAISEHELQAFFSNRQLTPTSWEFNTLIRMDKALRDADDDDKKQPEPDVED